MQQLLHKVTDIEHRLASIENRCAAPSKNTELTEQDMEDMRTGKCARKLIKGGRLYVGNSGLAAFVNACGNTLGVINEIEDLYRAQGDRSE